MINLENVKKAVQLQKEANFDINLFGQANKAMVNEMLELIDDFSCAENELFIELMNK